MKQITIDGRIGKDAEVLSTKGGKKYVRFSLANDTFDSGENKTEWFDITSYDPFVVENRVKYLTKGRYVIIHGSLKSEINTKNGNIYLNQYVTANNIETPSFGTKKEDGEAAKEETATISTFSSSQVVSSPSPTPTVQVNETPSPAYSYQAVGSDGGDDDLPF